MQDNTPQYNKIYDQTRQGNMIRYKTNETVQHNTIQGTRRII